MATINMHNSYAWNCHYEIVDKQDTSRMCKTYLKYRRKLNDYHGLYIDDVFKFANSSDVMTQTHIREALVHMKTILPMINMVNEDNSNLDH